MNFDELSSFCQPRLKTTLRYSAKSVRLGGYDCPNWNDKTTTSGTQRNWTRRATRCQCHCFLDWSLWILAQRPWLRHGSWLTRICLTFIDILHLKFDIGSFPLTFHALSLYGEHGSRHMRLLNKNARRCLGIQTGAETLHRSWCQLMSC